MEPYRSMSVTDICIDQCRSILVNRCLFKRWYIPLVIKYNTCSQHAASFGDKLLIVEAC